MIHQSWEPEHGPAHDVRALLRGLPDLSGVTPWDDAFAPAPAVAAPETTAGPAEPPAFVPLPEVAPLVEVEPLVPPPPAPPVPAAPSIPAAEAEPAAPRLYVASSWDSLGGAAPETALPQPYVEPAPVLEGKKATEVLAELGFLDD